MHSRHKRQRRKLEQQCTRYVKHNHSIPKAKKQKVSEEAYLKFEDIPDFDPHNTKPIKNHSFNHQKPEWDPSNTLSIKRALDAHSREMNEDEIKSMKLKLMKQAIQHEKKLAQLKNKLKLSQKQLQNLQQQATKRKMVNNTSFIESSQKSMEQIDIKNRICDYIEEADDVKIKIYDGEEIPECKDFMDFLLDSKSKFHPIFIKSVKPILTTSTIHRGGICAFVKKGTNNFIYDKVNLSGTTQHDEADEAFNKWRDLSGLHQNVIVPIIISSKTNKEKSETEGIISKFRSQLSFGKGIMCICIRSRTKNKIN